MLKRLIYILSILILLSISTKGQVISHTAYRFRTITTLPATCSPDDVWFQTSNSTFYGCTSTNTFTALSGGGGSGTVTSVSVTTANGVSGSVATATTTPAITLTLGAITPTTVNGNTFTTGTYTLTGTAGKVFTFSKTLTLTGTDSTVMTFPTTSATIARTDAANTFTGVQTLSDLAGTGSRAVLADTNGVLSAPVSDARLKMNISLITSNIDVLSVLPKIEGVYFNYNQVAMKEAGRGDFGSQREIGLTYQNLHSVLPELTGMQGGYGFVKYDQISAFLIEVAKAQQIEIANLKARIVKLEDQR